MIKADVKTNTGELNGNKCDLFIEVCTIVSLYEANCGIEKNKFREYLFKIVDNEATTDEIVEIMEDITEDDVESDKLYA